MSLQLSAYLSLAQVFQCGIHYMPVFSCGSPKQLFSLWLGLYTRLEVGRLLAHLGWLQLRKLGQLCSVPCVIYFLTCQTRYVFMAMADSQSKKLQQFKHLKHLHRLQSLTPMAKRKHIAISNDKVVSPDSLHGKGLGYRQS